MIDVNPKSNVIDIVGYNDSDNSILVQRMKEIMKDFQGNYKIVCTEESEKI